MAAQGLTFVVKWAVPHPEIESRNLPIWYLAVHFENEFSDGQKLCLSDVFVSWRVQFVSLL